MSFEHDEHKPDVSVYTQTYAAATEGQRIFTHGLGPCIGLVVYDPALRKTWLAHLLHANSGLDAANLAAMLGEAVSESPNVADLQIWVRGGSYLSQYETPGYLVRLARSHEAVRAALAKHGLLGQTNIVPNSPLMHPEGTRTTSIECLSGESLLITVTERDGPMDDQTPEDRTEEMFAADAGGRLIPVVV